MRILELIALLSKFGPKVQQAWPYIQQIIDAVQNILALLNAPSAAGVPNPQHVAAFMAAGATREEAETACTTLQSYEQNVLDA